jgi:hypothetical protein
MRQRVRRNALQDSQLLLWLYQGRDDGCLNGSTVVGWHAGSGHRMVFDMQLEGALCTILYAHVLSTDWCRHA